jgi:hypothetical protein
MAGCSREIFGQATIRIVFEQLRPALRETEIAAQCRVSAEHGRAAAAVITLTAIEEWVDVDPVAFANIGSPYRGLDHDSSRIQPDNRRHWRQMMPILSAHDGVHIGNDAASLHLDEQIARSWFRTLDFVDMKWLARLM